MSKRFNWKKPVVAPTEEKKLKANFNAISKKPKESLVKLTAMGTPDMKEIRKDIKERMKKFRRGI